MCAFTPLAAGPREDIKQFCSHSSTAEEKNPTTACLQPISTVTAKEATILTSGEETLQILEINTSYRPLRSICQPFLPFPPHVLSTATGQIQGFPGKLTLPPLLVSYIWGSRSPLCSRSVPQRSSYQAFKWGWTWGQKPLVGFNCRPTLGPGLRSLFGIFLQSCIPARFFLNVCFYL